MPLLLPDVAFDAGCLFHYCTYCIIDIAGHCQPSRHFRFHAAESFSPLSFRLQFSDDAQLSSAAIFVDAFGFSADFAAVISLIAARHCCHLSA